MKYIPWLITAMIALAVLSRPAPHAQGQPSNGFAVYLPLVLKPSSAVQTPEQSQMAQQVLALVNSERAAAPTPCAPLTMNDQLIVAAQGQSQDMALNDFFSHTNPDPSRATVGQRAAAAGYGSSYVGENIAVGYNTPTAVMAGWMNSDGHRASILNCTYTEIGVGYYYQADDQPFPGNSWAYYHYWTQVFGRP